MSISEQVTLVDGVSPVAATIARALGGIATALAGIKAAGTGLSSIAGELEAISKAQAAGGIDKINAKAAADTQLASAKAAIAEEAADRKAAAASALADQKAANDLDKLNAKGAVDERVAGVKAAIAEEASATKAAAAIALADQKAADASQKAEAKAAIDERLAATKGAIAQETNAQKAAQASDLAHQKAAAADALARNQAIAAMISKQADAASQAAKVQTEGATAAEKIQAQIVKDVTAAGKASAAVKAPSAAGGGGASQSVGGGGPDTEVQGTLGAMADKAGGLAAVLEKAAAAIASVIEKLASLVEKGAQIAIASGTFREDTVMGFKAMLGSATEADALYEKAMDVSDKIGLDKEQVVTRMSTLMEGGMGAKEALRAVEVIGDVTQGISDKAGSKLGTVLAKIQANGKIDKSTIGAMKLYGVGEAAVYEQLAKATGKSLAQVKTAVKAGTIDAATGIKAMEEAVEKRMEGLGEKAGQSITRRLGDIQDEFARLFDKISSGAGGQALKGVLTSISDGLTGPAGSGLKSALEELYGSLGTAMFGDIKKGDIDGVINTVAGAIRTVAGFIKDITPGLQGFGRGFIDGIKQWSGPMAGVAQAFLKLMGILGGMGSFWALAGRGVGYLIGFLVTLVEVILSVVGAVLALGVMVSSAFFLLLGGLSHLISWIADVLGDLWDTITGAWDSLSTSASGVGDNMMSSLAGGISGSAGKVLDAVIAATGNAIKAAERILGIASPSKVFKGIGLNVSKGAAIGITSGIPHVEAAIADMAGTAIGVGGSMSAPANGNAGSGGAGGAGGAAAGGVGEIHLHIHTPNGDPQTVSAAARDGAREGITDFMRSHGRRRAT